MDPDQTVSKGAVWSWSILLAIWDTKVQKQMLDQTEIIVNGGKVNKGDGTNSFPIDLNTNTLAEKSLFNP